MKPTLQYTIHTGNNAELMEQVVATLMVAGFDAILEEDGGVLRAGAEAERVDAEEAQRFLRSTGLTYEVQEIQPENWNEAWERSFTPIRVEDKVAVRASFHESIAGADYELVITPKMSFGTGHHATTWLMLQAMTGLNLAEKSVVDFGTGTGVLAILASKMGATSVLAIDHDEWSIENASENIAENGCNAIRLVKADSLPTDSRFDLVLANINKHIIIEHWQALTNAVLPGGLLLLSGLLAENQAEIEALILAYGFKLAFANHQSGWICVAAEKS